MEGAADFDVNVGTLSADLSNTCTGAHASTTQTITFFTGAGYPVPGTSHCSDARAKCEGNCAASGGTHQGASSMQG